MSLGGTQVDAIDVGAILQGVHDGVVVLPDFQRNFDWSESDTIAVLATILTKWPVGSLLLLEGAPSYLRTKRFNGVPDEPVSPSHRVEYVVLDGQQRITSLYHALWDRGRRVFAINLGLLDADHSPENLEEAIVTVNRSRWNRTLKNPQDQLRQGYVPVHALKSPSEFFRWRDEALLAVEEPVHSIQYERISSLYKDLFSGLDRYRVPAIIVPRKTPAGAIARIFERVNKTGQKLKTFDLMVAITYDGAFNLRDEWERARTVEAPIVGEFFGRDGMPALHVASLRHRESLRDSSVLQMNGSVVRDQWVSTISCLTNVAVFARRYLGMQTVGDAPNINALLVLAALSDELPIEDRHSEFERWFWSVAFSGRYDVASNTRAASDYRELRSSSPIDPTPVVLVREDALQATRRQRGAFHRAFAAFLAARLPEKELSTLSELKFESVLSSTDIVDGDDSFRTDATLGYAWKRVATDDNERNEGHIVANERQLLAAENDPPMLEGRLELLSSALRELGLAVKIVSSEDDQDN